MRAKQCRAEGHRWERRGSYRKCKRCGTLKREAPGPVTVKRPDPETGEVSEEALAQGSFKADDSGPISPAVREGILAGEEPPLIWPGDEACPVEKGQEIGLVFLRSLAGPVAQVAITITSLRRGKRGEHMADYSVRDDRALHLRHRHGYTRSQADSMDPDAPVLDPDTLKAFSTRSRLSTAEREEKRRENERRQERAAKAKLGETLAGLKPEGRAALLANIERACDGAKVGRLKAA